MLCLKRKNFNKISKWKNWSNKN